MTTQDQSDSEKIKLVQGEMDEKLRIMNENVEKNKSLWRGEKFTPSNDIEMDKADESDRVVEEFKRFLAGSKPNPDQPRLRPKVELDLKNIFKKKPAATDLKQRADGLSSNSLDFMNGVKEVGRRQRNRDMAFSFETMNTFFD